MRADLLHLLRCPHCMGKLQLLRGEMVNGTLTCRCGKTYPITNGIPRFVRSDQYAHSFSFEWHRHTRTQYDSHNRNAVSARKLREYLAMDLRTLRGKLVLDAGCGSGRFMEVAAKHGATVVGVDLSTAVDAAQEPLRGERRAHLIQADLSHLPFAPGTFDVIYSLGVLHHTPDAASAFAGLPPLLKRHGRIAVFVYASYHRAIVYSSAFWRFFTTHMPRSVLHVLCTLAIPLYYLYRIPLLGTLLKGALVISMDPNPRVRVLDTFDWYSPKYQSKHTHAEVAAWFSRAGLDIVAIPPGEISLVGVKR